MISFPRCCRWFPSVIAAAGWLAALPSGRAQTPARTAEVIFSNPPKESGLAVDRTAIAPVNEPSGDAWAAHQGSEPTQGWLRVFRFKVTDPWFQNGAHPVADLEITYRVSSPTVLRVRADTQEGKQGIFSQKVAANGWETVRIPLDNAQFSAADAPKDPRPSLSGHDVLVYVGNCELSLRSVRLLGYDLDRNVDWARVLKVGDITAERPGGVLAFVQGPAQQLNVPLRNAAHQPRPLHYRLQITDYHDRVRPFEGDVTVPAGGAQDLALKFDTSGWPLGPYDATLNFYLNVGDAQPVDSRTLRLGVMSSTVLDKARPGEFLYGLDPANNGQVPTHNPAAYAYYRLMGVDLLRSLWNNDMHETVEDAGRALAELGAENVQSMIISTPPGEHDPLALADALQKKDAFLKELARRYAGEGPGKLHYYELGNEPDLTGFFNAPMSEYLRLLYSMADAVKAGAREAGLPPGSTVVMNGGLAFVHPGGIARSREFMQLLDPTKIDAVAYHGHGPGIASERTAYERIRQTGAEFGKHGLTFIETESGVLATDRAALVEQARTAVEKMVYAQSVGLPTLIFFRLYMREGGEGGYGLTQNTVEPRPSVFGYRSMVERLRHQAFVATLDFAGKSGAQKVDGFLFEERNEKKLPTGRKTAVIFGEKLEKYDLLLRLGKTGVQDPKMYDLFGNELPLKLVSGNIASFTAGPDPIYLAWTSPDQPDATEVLRPLLRQNTAEPLLAGAPNPLNFSLYNPGKQPVNAAWTIEGHSRLPIRVEPAAGTVALSADQPGALPVNVTLGAADQPLRLPCWWKVFLHADPARADVPKLSAIPAELPGAGGQADEGQFAWTPENRLDFAHLAGTYSEKRAAIALAWLDSPAAAELPCAASGDFFMAWYLNGQKVCDTLETGNGQGGSLANHLFNLPLRAGRNLLAVVVLAGRGGWALDYAGPRERGYAVSGGVDPDRLVVTVKNGSQALTAQDVPMLINGPVPPLGNIGNPALLENWQGLEPLAVLEEGSAVSNPWMKEPDQSRWYNGKKDLSATVWLRTDGASLHLFAAVTDDRLVEASTPGELPQSDSLRVVLADDGGKTLADFTGGLVNHAPATIGTGGVAVTVSRLEPPGRDAVTLYHFTFPAALAGAHPFRFNLAVADNDAGYLKQTLDLGNVNKPTLGQRMILPGK